MTPEDLLVLVEHRLRALGMSAAAASTRAVGNHYLIRNIQRRRRWPSVDNLISLCRVLGLEFYVGPPRDDRAVSADTWPPPPSVGPSPWLMPIDGDPPGGPGRLDLKMGLEQVERLAALVPLGHVLSRDEAAQVGMIHTAVVGFLKAPVFSGVSDGSVRPPRLHRETARGEEEGDE